jgi:hypothetical protein
MFGASTSHDQMLIGQQLYLLKLASISQYDYSTLENLLQFLKTLNFLLQIQYKTSIIATVCVAIWNYNSKVATSSKETLLTFTPS